MIKSRWDFAAAAFGSDSHCPAEWDRLSQKKQKIYEPVREFERQTSYCSLYLAWRIVDEARDYFRTELVPSSGLATRKRHLIRPAACGHLLPIGCGEGIGRQTCPTRRGRVCQASLPAAPVSKRARTRRILTIMRHWQAGVLAKENPVLFHRLPVSCKIGNPLSETEMAGSNRPWTLRRGVPVNVFTAEK